jgi:hypothetical protein
MVQVFPDMQYDDHVIGSGLLEYEKLVWPGLLTARFRTVVASFGTKQPCMNCRLARQLAQGSLI